MGSAIEQYTGAHRDLYRSFRIADDSVQLLDSYIDLGQVWVTRAADGDVVGHVQIVPRDSDVWEITNTAVAEGHRGKGLGRALLMHALGEARASGARRVVLATGTADVGNLHFYQRCGFRMTHVVRDVFTPANGYPPTLEVNGIPLLDQVWFERVL